MLNRIRRVLHPTRPRHARTARSHKPLRPNTLLGQAITRPEDTTLVRPRVPTTEHLQLTPAEAA
ncbi:hypothetical protein SAMN05428939_5285 [Streptomyces sp. TLI_105]|nr:hypothetical protein SAMN05428939_5285 [Streptomyces sp. TLI_105]